MILKAILCVEHFCSFGAMSFIVNMLIKTDSTVICVPCMLEHVCYEAFSFKNCRFGRYLMLIDPSHDTAIKVRNEAKRA